MLPRKLTEKEIRKDERDKVLDKLDEWVRFEKAKGDWRWGIPFVQIHIKTRELRQEGEP